MTPPDPPATLAVGFDSGAVAVSAPPQPGAPPAVGGLQVLGAWWAATLAAAAACATTFMAIFAALSGLHPAMPLVWIGLAVISAAFSAVGNALLVPLWLLLQRRTRWASPLSAAALGIALAEATAAAPGLALPNWKTTDSGALLLSVAVAGVAAGLTARYRLAKRR